MLTETDYCPLTGDRPQHIRYGREDYTVTETHPDGSLVAVSPRGERICVSPYGWVYHLTPGG